MHSIIIDQNTEEIIKTLEAKLMIATFQIKVQICLIVAYLTFLNRHLHKNILRITIIVRVIWYFQCIHEALRDTLRQRINHSLNNFAHSFNY